MLVDKKKPSLLTVLEIVYKLLLKPLFIYVFLLKHQLAVSINTHIFLCINFFYVKIIPFLFREKLMFNTFMMMMIMMMIV